MHALAIASDLGQADYEANLVGMAIAKSALEAIVRMIGANKDDAHLLTTLEQMLSLAASEVPTVDVGLRLATLQIATNLEDETRGYLENRRRGLSAVFPWRAVMAWRLSRAERVVSLLEQVIETRDIGVRVRLASEIQHQAYGDGLASVDALPTNLVRAIQSSEYLERIYRATKAAIRLQQWHTQHGSYPKDIRLLRVSLEGLRYEPNEKADGYKIVIEQGDEAGTVLFAQPQAESSRHVSP
jgi:hypothetical protein